MWNYNHWALKITHRSNLSNNKYSFLTDNYLAKIGFLASFWCMTIVGLMWLKCVSIFCIMNGLLQWTGQLSPNWDPIQHMKSQSTHNCHVATQTIQTMKHSGFYPHLNALIDFWETMSQNQLSVASPGVVWRSYKHMETTHTTEAPFYLSWGISTWVGSACKTSFNFYFDYSSSRSPCNHFDLHWSF